MGYNLFHIVDKLLITRITYKENGYSSIKYPSVKNMV